jgi:peptide/nickel transport system substrate-binding protein
MMARPRIWSIGIAVVMAACAVCAACSGPAGSTPQGGGELVWGKSAEADVLDPTIAGTAISWEILHLSYENLVGLDDDLKLVPELAESWRQLSPMTYVFQLRKGAAFSNGRELTAEDVAGSLMRLMDPKLSSSWAGQAGIRNAVASGPDQVTVTLSAPNSAFVPTLAGMQASILPMKELEAGTFDPKKELLGTGPFMVEAHSQGESWTFVRNPHYWREGRPKVDKVTVRIMPEEAARTAALRDGSVDVTTFETPDSIRLLEGQTNVTTVVQDTTDYYRLDVNARKSVFRDPRLRQALALSVDRDKIRTVALAGVGKATAAVPPAYQGVCDPAAVPNGRPDAERARQLVQAAGATGKTVEIIAPTIVPMASSIAQVIQQSLEQTGFKVRISTLDIGELFKRAYNGTSADFDIIVSFFAGYVDPAMTPARYRPAVAGFNKGWVEPDPQLDALSVRSLSTNPGEARMQTLRDICARIAQNGNIVPLVTKQPIVAYRTDQVDAAVRRLEGYALPLRNLADFSLK